MGPRLHRGSVAAPALQLWSPGSLTLPLVSPPPGWGLPQVAQGFVSAESSLKQVPLPPTGLGSHPRSFFPIRSRHPFRQQTARCSTRYGSVPSCSPGPSRTFPLLCSHGTGRKRQLLPAAVHGVSKRKGRSAAPAAALCTQPTNTTRQERHAFAVEKASCRKYDRAVMAT